ncbi:helix-turn-helix domain-containing protein [Streptomyces sp. TRM 70361]|uniref:helix-turn-helix domain-containing protein n=1 Tax=Streptomyces sp. TRM 70361 TaxID=3116553 RepID=UPI002E7B2C83|nr:helix-turn-helix domain-containing protein [Streptomyces sp. TRM 70361]MEE1938966.1 helix-turn-helix domain-containing protein [Streptomyces sp. TRM 70361]
MTRASRTPLPPERARLAAVLRELKERTGLSLAGLAERTTYSKSSWDRYLNGRVLPPRQAVRDLCRLAGEPEGRCLALWEIAEAEWSGRAVEAARTSADTGTGTPEQSPSRVPPRDRRQAPRPGGRHGRRGAVAVVVFASVCAVVLGGVAALLLPPGGKDGPPSSPPPASGPYCRGTDCEGRNPIHMICAAGPDSLASYRTATGARMEVRYSRECGTSWARAWGTSVGDRIEVSADGRTHSAEVADELDAEAYVYTAMAAIRPGSVVRACFRPAGGGERECFDGRAVRGSSGGESAWPRAAPWRGGSRPPRHGAVFGWFGDVPVSSR